MVAERGRAQAVSLCLRSSSTGFLLLPASKQRLAKHRHEGPNSTAKARLRTPCTALTSLPPHPLPPLLHREQGLRINPTDNKIILAWIFFGIGEYTFFQARLQVTSNGAFLH